MTTPKFDDPNVPSQGPGQGPPAADNSLPDRIGPGSGDPSDSRPLGDPDAPQGSKPGDAHGGSMEPWQRPAPAGKVRTSWADGAEDKP